MIDTAVMPPPHLPRGPGAFMVATLAALAFAFGISLSGCGANPAQVAISTQAEIVVATQPVRFEAYALADERCGADHPGDLGAYRLCMRPARYAARAMDTYREALHVAQAAVHAGNGGPAIACAIEAATRALAALDAANLPLPSEILNLAALAPESACHAPGQ